MELKKQTDKMNTESHQLVRRFLYGKNPYAISVFRNSMFCVVGLGLAIFSIISTFGSIAQSKQPKLSLSNWSETGFALAAYADNEFKSEVGKLDGALPERYDKKVIDSSTKAFFSEPTSSIAVRMIALIRETEGKDKAARALMRKASELNRRDTATNAWLILDYAKANDLANTLVHYDYVLRVNDLAKPVLLPVLVESLKKDEAIEVFSDILTTEPPWAAEFWIEAAKTKSALAPAGLLRASIFERGINILPDHDISLLSAMIANRRFDDARKLHSLLTGSNQVKADNIVKNSDFVSASTFPPFDWKVYTTGTYGAAINQSTKRLDIFALSNADDVVAEQLIMLPVGQYRFSAQLSTQTAKSEGMIIASISCADNPNSEVRALKVEIVGTGSKQDFELTNDNCRYFWLRVSVRAPDDVIGFDTSISNIAIETL